MVVVAAIVAAMAWAVAVTVEMIVVMVVALVVVLAAPGVVLWHHSCTAAPFRLLGVSPVRAAASRNC